MTIKAILFDKDGTLIDFSGTFAPATTLVIHDLAGGNNNKAEELAAVLKFDLATEAFDTNSVLIAGSLENIAQAVLSHMDGYDLAGLITQIAQLYDQHSLASLSPFPELLPALDELAALGLPLGIATNDAEHTAIIHMEALGLKDRFSYIAGFDSGYGEKPGPGMVEGFIDKTGFEAKQTVMVGDSLTDCKAGRTAGAVVVAVTSGLADAATLSPHADHVLSSIGELPALIATLNGSEK